MNYDYSKIKYVLTKESNLDNCYISYIYYGTIYYLLQNKLYIYIANNNTNIIVYVINPNDNMYTHINKYIDSNICIKPNIYEEGPLEIPGVQGPSELFQRPPLYNYKIILCIFINNKTNYDFIYNIIKQFNYDNIFIIWVSCIDIYFILGKQEIYIKINEDNHMCGFLQALNYINCYNLKKDYQYIFKLYYHESNVVNYNVLNMNKDIEYIRSQKAMESQKAIRSQKAMGSQQQTIKGYGLIKYDYLDSYYVSNIFNTLNIKTKYNKYINRINNSMAPLAPLAQVSCSSKIYKNIISKTHFSYIPSSIYIIDINYIDFNIIDLYSYLEPNYTYVYDSQSFTNALNKYIYLYATK
jgi:hypothetical protein